LPSPVFPSYLSYHSPRASVGAERCQKMVFLAAIREKSRCWVALSYDAHSVSTSLGRIRQLCFRSLSNWILVRTFLKHSPSLRGKLTYTHAHTHTHPRAWARVNTCVSSIFCLACQQVTSPPPRCHVVLGDDCLFCFAGGDPCHLAGQRRDR